MKIEELKQIKKLFEKIKNNNNSFFSFRERKIFEYRQGIEDGMPHTLEETGKVFGLTRERIRQIEKKMIERIKEFDKGLDKNKKLV